ncbi:MAG TPA: sulfotransferase [Steroidobacteraceae bacterium]|nr:sulfotransferase [Steroidobacteraceae bacterium]
MLFKWLQAAEATRAGAALADDFYVQSATRPHGRELQEFLQKFLQRVDQVARPLKLNFFKRAKLANAFKWRMLEKGVQQEVVDELTQALVMRLSGIGAAPGANAAAAPAAGRRSASRNASQALHARGVEAMSRGDHADALGIFEELVQLDPRDAVARNGLGAALAQLARYAEAEDQFRCAVGIRSAYHEAYYNLANLLLTVGRYNEAEDPLRRALRLKPSHLDARISLGVVLALLGRLRDAKDSYEKVLRAEPRNAKAYVGIGQIEMLEGRLAEAETAFRRALEIAPDASYAQASLVWLRKMTPADAGWLAHSEALVAKKLSLTDEATLRFSMGKYCDDVADYPKAFRNYQRGNELQKLTAAPYDRGVRARFVDDLIRVYTPDAVAAARVGASDSARPVLVVGMPRSGTSLVEQILASHPAARGAGELNFWTVVMRKHEATARQTVLAEPLRARLAQDYLRVLAGHSADATRVIDKMPVNADYLGVIHSVFPNARVIYLQRDPIDTCLSCYFQQFQGALNFTMDLSDLASYYREHHRLMSHWRAVLPQETLLDVPYAELTADPERWTRRMLEFVGLPWDARCLEYHKTARAVRTASVWQVRQKMYQTSVGRWRNYEKFIGPLRELKDLPV